MLANLNQRTARFQIYDDHNNMVVRNCSSNIIVCKKKFESLSIAADVPPNSSDYHRRRGTPSVQHDPKCSTKSPRLPSGCDERSSKFSEELHPSRSLSEELHPSWAAARRKKRAEEGGVMEFQGQKIVFSDSD